MKIDEKVESEFLASILQNKNIIDTEVLNDIEPGYFTIESYQWIVKKLKNRGWKPIASGYLDQELLEIKDEQKIIQFRVQLSRLYNLELSFVQDASNKFKEYIAYCIINSTIRSSSDNFNRSGRIDFLISDISKGVSSAKNIIDGELIKVIDYANDYEHRQELRRNTRNNPNINPRILTGIPGLDEQFTIKAPMIIDFIAPFKRYKSIILNAMGDASLLQGFNVAHIIYENSIELTTDRYDSMFSGLNYQRVSNMLITSDEKQMMDRMFEWMKTWSNRLKIIKGTPKGTTVEDIEEKLERIADKEGWVPDVEIWDYINIIKPTKEFREERLSQGQIIWDLKNHAEKFGVPIIEASQARMDGVNTDRMDLSHRGKSIDISQGVNLSIAIDQSKKEKEGGIIVLSPQFSREFKITIPEVVLDADISRMQISKSINKLWEHAVKIHPY